jgi:hypothetical protein
VFKASRILFEILSVISDDSVKLKLSSLYVGEGLIRA